MKKTKLFTVLGTGLAAVTPIAIATGCSCNKNNPQPTPPTPSVTWKEKEVEELIPIYNQYFKTYLESDPINNPTYKGVTPSSGDYFVSNNSGEKYYLRADKKDHQIQYAQSSSLTVCTCNFLLQGYDTGDYWVASAGLPFEGSVSISVLLQAVKAEVGKIDTPTINYYLGSNKYIKATIRAGENKKEYFTIIINTDAHISYLFSEIHLKLGDIEICKCKNHLNYTK